jgi:hypothetical protein
MYILFYYKFYVSIISFTLWLFNVAMEITIFNR